MRRLPPLAAVRVFEAAARHLNFTTAAEELGMTQAAVSYQVKLLEERLGVALFHRERRRVRLTEAGRLAAPLVGQGFDLIDAAFSAARRQNADLLTISAPQTFASTWLAPRLGEFQIAHPDMAVRVQTSPALTDFAREEVDLAIRTGKGPWPGLRMHFLFRQHFTAMCNPAFLAAHGPFATPADLLHARLISPNYSWWRCWFDHCAVAEPTQPLRPGFGLDAQADDGFAALAGQGIALMTPCLWRRELADGRLAILFADCVAEDGSAYWLVYPEQRARTPKIARFREWILHAIAAQAAAEGASAFVDRQTAAAGD